MSLPLPKILEDNSSLMGMVQDKNKEVIFYSDGTTCGLCTGAAKIARAKGFTNVKVLLVGAQSWEEEGEVLAVSDERILDKSSIVIDVREKDEVSNGHIPGAISLTSDELSGDEVELDFPTDRRAPIVFYGTDIQISKAMAVVSGWGYRQLRQVDGGVDGWQKRSRDLTVGRAPGAEGITWVPRVDENEISTQEFTALMKATPDDTLILDVRTAKEAEKGRIKTSQNIALENLSEQLALIPVGKKIVTHCATGSRAEVAAQFLSQYRDDVRFLAEKVRCKGEKCRVR